MKSASVSTVQIGADIFTLLINNFRLHHLILNERERNAIIQNIEKRSLAIHNDCVGLADLYFCVVGFFDSESDSRWWRKWYCGYSVLPFGSDNSGRYPESGNKRRAVRFRSEVTRR